MCLLGSAKERNEICLPAGQIACQGGISVNNALPVGRRMSQLEQLRLYEEKGEKINRYRTVRMTDKQADKKTNVL